MTGFGRARPGRAVVEVQTLNHRFLEVECRLPEGFQALESELRSTVSRAIRRGRVRVSVSAPSNLDSRAPGSFRQELIRQYLFQIRQLKRRLKLPGEITLPMVLGLPQVIAPPERGTVSASEGSSLRKGLAEALQQVLRMRRKEGRQLSRVLLSHAKNLERFSAQVARRTPTVHRRMRRGFEKRLKTLLRAADPRVVASEAASFAQSADVSEELSRIRIHLSALSKAAQGNVEAPGRTIDFLAQELQREVNTLGSKMRDAQVIRAVVAMKNQIEKIREQAANVE